MISINENKGFSMTFANGWTVSVQIGVGNYCDNYYIKTGTDNTIPMEEAFQDPKPSRTAEIAAWSKERSWHDFGDDKVKGYCKPDEILDFMNMIKEK